MFSYSAISAALAVRAVSNGVLNARFCLCPAGRF
jgi:hypothetical protein